MRSISASIVIYKNDVRLLSQAVASFLNATDVLSLAALLMNPVAYYRNVDELSKSNFRIAENSMYKTSAEITASLWWLSWKAVQDVNPIVGSGTRSVKKEIQKQSEQHHISNVLESFDPHNQYLFYMIGNGVVGLTVFLLTMFLPVLAAYRERDFLYLSFTALCGLLFMTESALELQKGIAFVAIIGSVLCFQRKSFQFLNLKIRPLSADR